MKIQKSKKIMEKIGLLTKQRSLNEFIQMTLSYPISTETVYLKDPENLPKYKEGFRNMLRPLTGKEYTEDQCAIGAMILSVINGVGAKIEDLPVTMADELVCNSRVFHEGEMESNQYYRNIHFDIQEMGRFKLKTNSYEPYELTMYNTPKVIQQQFMIPAIGMFDYKFTYPQIVEGGSTWMSVTPNEIYTMQRPIAEAKGNVLTLGCGMGYYAYMVSEKDDVDHVTIIEKEPDVIELFNTYILPQFAHKDKVMVIQADAFDYMEKLEDGVFDYCFADIWIGNLDIIPYIRLKKMCRRFRKTKVSYWIEDSIVAASTPFVSMLIMAEAYRACGIPMPEITDVLTDEQRWVKDYYGELLGDVEISRPDQVDYLLDYRNLINLIR